MKKLILPIGVAALLIAACGKKDENQQTPATGATQPAQTAPAGATTTAPADTTTPAQTTEPAAAQQPTTESKQ